MQLFSKNIIIHDSPRGFNIITDKIIESLPEINTIINGVLLLFIQHTSASLTINENADNTVRNDLEQHFNRTIKENLELYTHNYEGKDDMPAHIKSSIIGCNLHIPIQNGKLSMGTWQGIYLCEHRDRPTSRSIMATIIGNI